MSGKYMAYVGSYSYTGRTKGITVYDMGVKNGTFRERCEMEVDNSSYVIASNDGKTLYSTVDGRVVSFRILQNGGLAKLNSAPTRDMRSCHLYTDMGDRYVLVSGYHDGKTTVLSLNKGGSVGQIVDEMFNKGYGSVTEHNFRSRITCTRRMPGGRCVLSVDNGTDQVKVYRFNDENKRLFQVGTIHCDLESAPRHFRFSSDGRFLYLMHELQNVICVYFCETGGRAPVIEEIRTISTTSTGDPGNLTAAYVMKLSPDEKYVYCTNVGENTVSIYSRDEKSGLLTMICCLLVSGEYPRGMAVFPDQKHIASINHDNSSISFFEVDYEKSLIVMCGHSVMVSEPNCYAIAKIRNQIDKTVGPLIQEDRRQHMAGSVLGTILRVTTWGESHGEGIGVVMDGYPVGLPLGEEDIQSYLNRRKPGQGRFITTRQEGDQVETLSSVFEGRTTGTPIALKVRNTDQRSHDYSNIMDIYRPGHADYTFDQKYEFRDYKSSRQSSGRETITRVATGAIACKLLESLGITVKAYTREVGGIDISQEHFDLNEIWNNRLYVPDVQAAARAETRLEELMAGKDSCGGMVECIIYGMSIGADEPVFGKLGANLAKAIVSIGAVRGSEIEGDFAASRAQGSENSDGFGVSHRAANGSLYLGGEVGKQTSHSGGALGGISGGSGTVVRTTFEPTPSIGQPQRTVSQRGEETVVKIKGHHDPITVPRVVMVVEAIAALTATDVLLLSMTFRLDRVQTFFAQDRV